MGKAAKIDEYRDIACRMTSAVIGQLNCGIECIDAEELGEVVDIIKDMEEAIMYCEQACYYKKVTEAMDKASDEEKGYYMNTYAPETKLHGGGNEYNNMRKRMYYNTTADNNHMDNNHTNNMYEHDVNKTHDPKEGKSYMARKGYMEAREWGETDEIKKKELEKYMDDLAFDITELISGMTATEKQMLKQKLTAMAGKI